jgi:hypothetical protein
MKGFATQTILCALIANEARAFAPSSVTHATISSSSLSATNDNNSSLMSRSDLFQNLIKSSLTTAAIAVSTTTLPQPAYADVTNKVASKAALRYIKRAIKEFEKLEFNASNNDFTEIKAGLRTPALSEIRKNAGILIKGGEDTAEAENLVAAYAAFIKDIEKLDGDASLGLRGRRNVQLLPSYDQTLKALKEFEEIAIRATTIPEAVGETSDVVAVAVEE